MMTCYRFDPAQSRFTVQVFATGMLSFFGHNPTFTVRDYAGEIRFDGGEVEPMSLELRVRADPLEVRDKLSPADRREIETRMRREVLETAAFPEIVYQAEDVSAHRIGPGQYRLRIGGRLSLHGALHPQPVEAELRIYDDGVQLLGSNLLRLSDYGIRPVTALGGAIKLKDELLVAFDLIGLPEGP